MELFAAFQLLSFGTLPPGASKHITAAHTFTTAGGGEPNDFNSVKLFWNWKPTNSFMLSNLKISYRTGEASLLRC